MQINPILEPGFLGIRGMGGLFPAAEIPERAVDTESEIEGGARKVSGVVDKGCELPIPES